jgi:hypothetical protein
MVIHFKNVTEPHALNTGPDSNPAIYHNVDSEPGFVITLEVKLLHFFFPFSPDCIFKVIYNVDAESVLSQYLIVLVHTWFIL